MQNARKFRRQRGEYQEIRSQQKLLKKISAKKNKE
jgi:hypothetical protein